MVLLFRISGRPVSSVPFHHGMGLQTIHGIPKPTYRMFEMLHRMGTTRLQVECSTESTVEMAATRSGNQLKLIVYNHQVPRASICDEEVCIQLRGVTSRGVAQIERVDRNSANPRKKWVEMGSPVYPTHEQLAELFNASVPVIDRIESLSSDIEYTLH